MNSNLNTAPKGVVFAKAREFALECFKEQVGKTYLISQDLDYFSLAKTVKDEIENFGGYCETIVLDDQVELDVSIYSDLFNFENDSLVICVGKPNLINFVKYYAFLHNAKLVVVPTTISVTTVFADNALIIKKGLQVFERVKKPEKVVVDLLFLAGLKKQVFADGFCEACSKLVSLIDAKAQAILTDEKIPNYFNFILSQIEGLCQIDSSSGKNIVKIINAQLKIGVALSQSPSLLNGSENAVSYVLSKIKESSFYENAFYAIKPIITLYEAFLSYPIHKTVVSPNYNGRIGQLSTLLNVSKLSVIKNYNPIGYDEMEKIYSKLINSDLLFFVKKCGKLCEKLNSCYGYIYKGKQKRAEFDYLELKRSLILAPYIGGGLLKIISDSGVLECLE